MGRFRECAVAIILMLATVSCGSGGGPKIEPGPSSSQPAWPMAGGNAQRNGQSSLPGPELGSEFSLLEDYWVYDDTDADIFHGITRHVMDSDGNIYFASLESIYSIAADGTLRWTRDIFDAEFDAGYYMDTFCAPVITSDNKLILASGAEDIFCLDFDGNLLWKMELEGDGTQLLAASGRIYATAGFNVYAIANDAQQLWEKNLGDWISWATLPAMSPNGDLLLSMDDAGFIALDQNGNQLWDYKPDNPASELATTIVYADSMWIVPDADGWIAFSEQGEMLWQLADVTTVQNTRSAPVMDQAGQLYFLMSAATGEHRTLSACNREGQIQWSVDNLQGSNGAGQDLMVDSRGRIYAMYLAGVSIYDNTGSRLGAFQYIELDNPQQFWTLSLSPGNKLIVGARSAGIVGMC